MTDAPEREEAGGEPEAHEDLPVITVSGSVSLPPMGAGNGQ